MERDRLSDADLSPVFIHPGHRHPHATQPRHQRGAITLQHFRGDNRNNRDPDLLFIIRWHR